MNFRPCSVVQTRKEKGIRVDEAFIYFILLWIVREEIDIQGETANECKVNKSKWIDWSERASERAKLETCFDDMYKQCLMQRQCRNF